MNLPTAERGHGHLMPDALHARPVGAVPFWHPELPEVAFLNGDDEEAGLYFRSSTRGWMRPVVRFEPLGLLHNGMPAFFEGLCEALREPRTPEEVEAWEHREARANKAAINEFSPAGPLRGDPPLARGAVYDRFVAIMQVDKKLLRLGVFDTADEASAAALDVKRRTYAPGGVR